MKADRTKRMKLGWKKTMDENDQEGEKCHARHTHSPRVELAFLWDWKTNRKQKPWVNMRPKWNARTATTVPPQP